MYKENQITTCLKAAYNMESKQSHFCFAGKWKFTNFPGALTVRIFSDNSYDLMLEGLWDNWILWNVNTSWNANGNRFGFLINT
jgi:hypothetical protein